jgi:hypothetical protein
MCQRGGKWLHSSFECSQLAGEPAEQREPHRFHPPSPQRVNFSAAVHLAGSITLPLLHRAISNCITLEGSVTNWWAHGFLSTIGTPLLFLSSYSVQLQLRLACYHSLAVSALWISVAVAGIREQWKMSRGFRVWGLRV